MSFCTCSLPMRARITVSRTCGVTCLRSRSKPQSSRTSVDIEERELHYSADAPLRAWRLFRVRTRDEGVFLSSAMYHDPDHVPWEEAVHVASCSEGHDAPAPGCRCGIYGAVEGVLDSLPG